MNEEERDAYFDQDISRLEAIWIQESTSRRVFRSNDKLIILDGWNEIYKNYKEGIDAEWWGESENFFANFSNYNINLYENSALVYHHIQWTGKIKDEVIDSKQERIVHFIKENGVWKFDFIAQLTIPAEKEVTETESGTEGTE